MLFSKNAQHDISLFKTDLTYVSYDNLDKLTDNIKNQIKSLSLDGVGRAGLTEIYNHYTTYNIQTGTYTMLGETDVAKLSNFQAMIIALINDYVDSYLDIGKLSDFKPLSEQGY